MNKPDIIQNRHLIGVTSFKVDGDRYALQGAYPTLGPVVEQRKDVVLISQARGKIGDRDDLLEESFKNLGASRITRLHNYPGDEIAILADAGMIYIGGGDVSTLSANIFAEKNTKGELVDQRAGAVQVPIRDILRNSVGRGVPLAGQSAGQMVMTEDMSLHFDPMVISHPDNSIAASNRGKGLGILPEGLFVSPHFSEDVLEDEARQALLAYQPRLREYILNPQATMVNIFEEWLEANQDRSILALENGAYFVVEGMRMSLEGQASAHLFRKGRVAQSFKPGSDVSFLLQ